MFTATITKDEIRQAWREIQDGKNPVPTQSALSSHVNGDWRSSDPYITDWQGCTGPEMMEWLDNGYDPEGEPLEFDANGAQEILFPTLQTSEDEGELMIDAVLSGDDEYRLLWEDVPAPRSIKIIAQINMLGGTPASVLADYCNFVLLAIDAAKAQGAAPALTVMHKVDGSVDGEGRCEFFIPLVEEGEEIDPTAWRAFVSKASFRTLGFLARGIACHKVGKRLRGGLGRSAGIGWDVRADGDTVTITCPPSDSRFPAETMARKLKEVFTQ